MLAFQQNVKQTRSHKTVLENSLRGQSNKNGFIENANRFVAGQIITLRSALQSNLQHVIGRNHIIIKWLVKYAATLINIASVGKDSKTAYDRRHGRKWKKALPIFGECIWWMRPESKGEQKLETRWEDGVYLGVVTESGEIIVGNHEGVVEVRTFSVRPQGERWK